MQLKSLRHLGTLVMALLPAYATATDAVNLDAKSQEYFAPVGSWQVSVAIGYGELHSPLSDQRDVHLPALPSIRYYGERFYLDNAALGFSLYETPHLALDLATQFNTDGLFFPGNDDYLFEFSAANSTLWDANAPVCCDDIMPSRKRMSYMGGVVLSGHSAINFRLAAYTDVSSVHGGEEVLLSLSKTMNWHNLQTLLELGASYKSEDLVDYYYGVEVTTELGPLLSYHPRAALNSHLKFEARYPLSPSWSLVAAGKVEHLDNEITNSPIVVEQDIGSFFVGLRYVF